MPRTAKSKSSAPPVCRAEKYADLCKPRRNLKGFVARGGPPINFNLDRELDPDEHAEIPLLIRDICANDPDTSRRDMLLARKHTDTFLFVLRLTHRDKVAKLPLRPWPYRYRLNIRTQKGEWVHVPLGESFPPP